MHQGGKGISVCLGPVTDTKRRPWQSGCHWRRALEVRPARPLTWVCTATGDARRGCRPGDHRRLPPWHGKHAVPNPRRRTNVCTGRRNSNPLLVFRPASAAQCITTTWSNGTRFTDQCEVQHAALWLITGPRFGVPCEAVDFVASRRLCACLDGHRQRMCSHTRGHRTATIDTSRRRTARWSHHADGLCELRSGAASAVHRASG